MTCLRRNQLPHQALLLGLPWGSRSSPGALPPAGRLEGGKEGPQSPTRPLLLEMEAGLTLTTKPHLPPPQPQPTGLSARLPRVGTRPRDSRFHLSHTALLPTTDSLVNYLYPSHTCSPPRSRQTVCALQAALGHVEAAGHRANVQV